MARGRTFTREFKLAVVRQVERGERRPAQVCREHGLADGVLWRWRRAYAERGEAAFAPPAADTRRPWSDGSPNWSASVANWRWRTRC